MSETEGLTTFTCLACRVGFSSSETQREHYKTDWHRYNLKRKIAGMVAVSAENFRERVTAQQVKEQEAKDKSRKGKKENNARAEILPIMKRAAEESAEPTAAAMEEEDLIDSRPAPEPVILSLESCIFCKVVSSSFEDNLKHMTSEHSFFVPDIEYIDNLEGLIRFLQSKVTENFQCLYCNGKSRAFQSVDAVRKHMVDKGHCMIDYSDEGRDETSDFYDFTTSYPDWEDVESGEEDAELTDSDIMGAQLSDTGFELVLASGARAGHRALRRYYRQYIRDDDTRDSVVTQRLVNSRRAIGDGSTLAVLPVRERIERDKFVVRTQYMRQIIAIRQNALQFPRRSRLGLG